MGKVVGVRFKRGCKIYDFDAGLFVLRPGDMVIVETEQGLALGQVARPPMPASQAKALSSLTQDQLGPARDDPSAGADKTAPEQDQGEEAKIPEFKLKKVFRLATEDDLKQVESNTRLEREAYAFCMERVQARRMDMNLVQVETLFDRSKIIFYFTAEGRLDFRELVRDLVNRFRTRIEMRQIGVRHEAKLLGGLGSCGRELCCTTFLKDFEPVSVKMAKEQNLSLNPTKISGLCGRLMCCLTYEYQAYHDFKKSLPKLGKRFTFQGGLEGKIIRQNVLKRLVTVYTPDGRELTGTPEQLHALPQNAESVNPPEEGSADLTAPPPVRRKGQAEEKQPEGKKHSRSRRDRRPRKKPAKKPQAEAKEKSDQGKPRPKSRSRKRRKGTK